MKYLFVLISIFTISSADYLNTKYNNQCVYDVEPKQYDEGLCYTKTKNDNTVCKSDMTYDDLIDGYYYDFNTGKCLLKNDLKITGLTQNEWDYMLASLAHALGFTMLFLINFLSVLIVRK